jgi:hypothetical protein
MKYLLNFKTIKDLLNPLRREALKFDDYKEFSQYYSLYGNHGLYYHVTENPNWKYDTELGSRDMSSMASGNVKEKGSLMVTSDLDNWNNYYNYDQNDNKKANGTRDYVAIFDLGDVSVPKSLGRGFGHEIYLTPKMASSAKLLDFLPIDRALKLDKQYRKVRPGSEAELYNFWKEAHKLDK